MKKLKKFIFLIIIVLVMLCFFEMALRFTGDWYLKRLYIHRYPDHRPSPGKINVICLGESSTAGLWVQPQDSYPGQLEAMLRREYPGKDIQVIVPPHVGQNTSQVANRIEHYIDFYKPRLIILMVGYNNEWSLAESHIGKFLDANNDNVAEIKSLILLNNLRLFKLLRYLYLEHIVREESEYMQGLRTANYAWGGPALVRWPPKRFVYPFAAANREAFIKLWRYDVGKIISTAKKHNINTFLMTYHINPSYLSAKEFVSMAHKENIPLVRNDKTFRTLIDNRTIMTYLLEGKDNWHPNRNGYNLIAGNAFQVIRDEKLLDK